MNQIWLLLGLKPEGFRAGLKRARDDTKGFEADWKGLKKIFTAGGIATLALGFLKAFAADAQAARSELASMGEPIPRTTRALAELGDTMDTIKKWTMAFVGFVVSGWQSIGDVTAQVINRMRGVSEAQENAYMAIYEAANQAEERLAKARKENSPEKIAAAEKKLAEARRDSAFQAADTEGKMNILLQENIRLRQLVNTTGEHSIKGAEARIALEKNLVEIRKTDADLTKEQAQRQKAIDDQTLKNWDEMIRREKAREAMRERLKKAQFESLSLEEQVEALTRSQYELENSIAAAKLKKTDTLALEVDLAELLLTLDDKRSSLAAQRAATEEKTTKEMQKQVAVMGFLVRGFSQFRDASPEALRDLISKNEQQIRERQFKLQLDPGNLTSRLDIGRLQQETANARQELDSRESLMRDYQFGGTALARRNFKGDPLAFDEVLQRVTGQWEKQDEANDLLRDIRTGLTARESSLTQLPDQVRDLTSATKAVATQLAQRGLRS